jgi:hypothetical protein
VWRKVVDRNRRKCRHAVCVLLSSCASARGAVTCRSSVFCLFSAPDAHMIPVPHGPTPSEGGLGISQSALTLLAAYTDLRHAERSVFSGFFLYASRCTYIVFMRKPFEAKFLQAHETVDNVRADVRNVSKSVSAAAHSQAQLNIALTAVAVTALLLAAILVRSQRTGAGQ